MICLPPNFQYKKGTSARVRGEIPLHEMYILDTQEKTDPRDTDRFLLNHWETQRLSSKWKSEDLFLHRPLDSRHPPLDDSEDQVELARGKFREAEGARERPYAIE